MTGTPGAENRAAEEIDSEDVDSIEDSTLSEDVPQRAVSRPRASNDRSDRMVRHLRRAVELSYPLYTFSELKRVLRCEYHALISDLRAHSSKTWGELTLLTGMTRAGLNKLGDEVPPRAAHSAIRTLLVLLQEAGGQGLKLPQLASRYYERCPDLEDGPSFEEALRALVDTGEVAEREGRYLCATHSQTNDAGLADDIEGTVGRIADAVRAEDGFGVAQLHRVSLRVPADPEAQRRVLRAMRDAVCRVAVEAEAEAEAMAGASGAEAGWLTVVVGGGPDLV